MLLFFTLWFSKKSLKFEIWEVVIFFVRYLTFSHFFLGFHRLIFLLVTLNRSWWTEEKKRVFSSHFCLIRGNCLEHYSYYLKTEAMFWTKEPRKKVFFFWYQNPIFLNCVVSMTKKEKMNCYIWEFVLSRPEKGKFHHTKRVWLKKNFAKASKF